MATCALTCSLRPAGGAGSRLTVADVAAAGFEALPVAMVTAPFPRWARPRGLRCQKEKEENRNVKIRASAYLK